MITSTHNPRLVATLRLRAKRERERRGLTLIDGVRETTRALDGGAEIHEAFVAPRHRTDEACRELLAALADRGIPIVELGDEAFERLAYGDRVDGVVAVAATPMRTLEQLAIPDDALVGVFERVEKPGNLGAALRSADGAGVDALVVADSAIDLFNPNVIRASVGTIFTVPVASAPSAAVMAWLRARGSRIVAASAEAENDYWTVDLRRPTAIVLGSEAHGLGTVWSEPDVVGVRMPMLGVGDSLNVSVAAAILFYEALRQDPTGAAGVSRRART